MLWKLVTSQVDIKNYSYDFVLVFNGPEEVNPVRNFFFSFFVKSSFYFLSLPTLFFPGIWLSTG